jgi:hypothetical protein
MSPQDIREAVRRHLPLLALVRGAPADLDDWLGLVPGATEKILATMTENDGEQRKASGISPRV